MAEQLERVQLRPDEERAPDTNLAWKDASPEDVGPAAYRAARWVYRQQGYRQSILSRCDLLYDGIRGDSSSFAGSAMANYLQIAPSPEPDGPPKLSLNVVRAVVDTAVARITGLDVRPQYVTSGGNWKQQQQARGLERFSDGQAAATGLRTLGPEIFRDALVADLGVAYTYALDDEVVTERVMPEEILVDTNDGKYGKPYQLFRIKWVPREVLMATYPDAAEKIRTARADAWDVLPNNVDGDRLLTHLPVIAAWHRPFFKGGKGRHVVAIENATLRQEEYNRHRFPFSIVRYSRPRRGFYGRGMAQHLRGNQRQINHTLQTIMQVAQHSVPSVWLEEGNEVAKGQLTNEIMAVRTYVGREPVLLEGAGPHQALWQEVKELYRGSFEQEGVSMMDAHGEKPPGVDSGVGLREYRDIGTERFSVSTKNYEEFRLDISEEQVECGREIYKSKKSFSILVPGSKVAEHLDFSKVNLERDKYVIQVFPSSSLPKEPAGRLAMITDLLKNGMLSATDGKRLLGFPDLEATTSLELAPFEVVLAEVSRLEEGEDFRGPAPFMNLDFAAKVGQWSWCRAYQHGAPEDILENLQLWTEQAQAMLKMFGGAPAAPGQADAGLGQALGKPAAAPTADGLPLPTAGAPAPGAAA